MSTSGFIPQSTSNEENISISWCYRDDSLIIMPIDLLFCNPAATCNALQAWHGWLPLKQCNWICGWLPLKQCNWICGWLPLKQCNWIRGWLPLKQCNWIRGWLPLKQCNWIRLIGTKDSREPEGCKISKIFPVCCYFGELVDDRMCSTGTCSSCFPPVPYDQQCHMV